MVNNCTRFIYNTVVDLEQICINIIRKIRFVRIKSIDLPVIIANCARIVDRITVSFNIHDGPKTSK